MNVNQEYENIIVIIRNYSRNMLTTNRTKLHKLRYKKIIKWKNINKKEQTIISEIFCDYLNNSTLHGISYMGAKDRNWIEKSWWIIGFILSVIASIYFINKTWIKWTENPVIITFAQEDTSVWDVPFPAVTFCPLTKVRQTKYNYTAYYITMKQIRKPGEEELLMNTEMRKKFCDISFICSPQLSLSEFNRTDEDIVTNIKMVSPTRIDTLGTWVIWKNDNITTNDFVADQITKEGLCFTFNALGHKDMYTEQMKEGVNFLDFNTTSTGWTLENGYSITNKDIPITDYPLRTSEAGLDNALKLDLMAAMDRTQYCGKDVGGFKMVVHNPAEIPRLSESYSLIPANQKVIVQVTPRVIRTSKDLMSVDPKTRNCYFDYDRKLRFFKIYTQYNCKLECLANITRQYCGCIPFYLPRDNKTEICGFATMGCMLHANDLEFIYSNMLKEKDPVPDESEKKGFEIFKQCNCMVSCDYIDYTVEHSQAENLSIKLNYANDKQRAEKTPMLIYFKESQFLALERNELYGQTDFISNIGGLLGLFMGFSFLSLLEIIYYVTLRTWCKIYQNNKNKVDIISNSQAQFVWLK